jgi:hypothetical protein
VIQVAAAARAPPAEPAAPGLPPPPRARRANPWFSLVGGFPLTKKLHRNIRPLLMY